MKTWNLLVVTILVCTIHVTASEKCENEIKNIECSATEYQNYVDCIRSRMKRSADCYKDEEEDCSSNQCEVSCDDCNCNECTSSDCGNSCNRRCCSSCCEFKECSTNHCCHKLCHNSCKTSSCRSSCRRSCYKSVRREKTEVKETYRDIATGENTSSNSSNILNNRGSHNVSTIIHLNNFITNKNLIDVPINLTNANVNNITVENSQNGSSTLQSGGSNQCCSVIEPRQCVRTGTYPFVNCFHLRRQQCGQFCRGSVMHKVAQNVCFNSQTQNPTCGQQIIYVPQPQMSCAYQSQWPYVTCSGQAGNCNGCYDYLLNPLRTQKTCSPYCYSYGINQGAVYRQGPILNPGYSLPLPSYNPVSAGCVGYGGCGLTNMGTYINPGTYYGMNAYSNYGIYGSYTPYMAPAAYGDHFSGGTFGNLPYPLEQLTAMNFTATNSSNVLYGVLTNSTLPIAPLNDFTGAMYGQSITIDEDTLKKLLGQISPQEEEAGSSSKVQELNETEQSSTTTSSSLFSKR